MSKKYIGITQNQAGYYVTATIEKDDSGKIETPKFSSTDTVGFKQEILWGANGVVCGTPVKYRAINSSMVYEQQTEALNSNEMLQSFASSNDIKLDEEIYDSHLVKISGENSFLTTVPQYFSDLKKEDFISIYFTEDGALLSITLDKKQKFIFNFVGDIDSELVGFIGRVQRYWEIKFPKQKFPIDTVIAINRVDSPVLLKLQAHFISLASIEALGIDEIRALGLALSHFDDNTPVFKRASARAAFRETRNLIHIISVSLVLIGLFLTVLFYLMNSFSNYRLNSLEKEYSRIIAADSEIKQFTNRNIELAKTILYMESNISKRTRWAKFLNALGVNAPEGLFIEKLGSEPVKGASGQVKIALLGFSSKEVSITELISLLQKTAYITKVSLVSMEKDKKRSDKFRFKVLCTLLSEK